MKTLLSEYGSRDDKGAEIERIQNENGTAYKVTVYRSDKVLYEALFDDIERAESFAEDLTQ